MVVGKQAGTVVGSWRSMGQTVPQPPAALDPTEAERHTLQSSVLALDEDSALLETQRGDPLSRGEFVIQVAYDRAPQFRTS